MSILSLFILKKHHFAAIIIAPEELSHHRNKMLNFFLDAFIKKPLLLKVGEKVWL